LELAKQYQNFDAANIINQFITLGNKEKSGKKQSRGSTAAP